MLCNPVSYYTIKIDEMTCFQDNDLEKVEIINTYDSLVAQGRYSEAIDYINQQKGIYGFFADFFLYTLHCSFKLLRISLFHHYFLTLISKS